MECGRWWVCEAAAAAAATPTERVEKNFEFEFKFGRMPSFTSSREGRRSPHKHARTHTHAHYRRERPSARTHAHARGRRSRLANPASPPGAPRTRPRLEARKDDETGGWWRDAPSAPPPSHRTEAGAFGRRRVTRGRRGSARTRARAASASTWASTSARCGPELTRPARARRATPGCRRPWPSAPWAGRSGARACRRGCTGTW